MPKRLAEIIVETGLASRQEVMRAAQLAETQKKPLIAALVRDCKMDEVSLVAAIKRHVRVAMVDPAAPEHDPDAIRELPRDVCTRLRVMPLSIAVFDASTRILRLAMADPTDAVAIAEVEHITGCQVESALMPLSAIEELIDKAYRAYVTAVMPRGRGPGPAGALEAVAQAVDEAETTAPRAKPPTTVPFHRVSDEASLELRHRALLELLLNKEIIGKDEYEEQVRRLMREQADEG